MCNLAGLRLVLHVLSPPADVCLVDGFRLGKAAPEHLAVVGGDGRSAAIAAASIVAKVVRDRVMHRLDALIRTTALRPTSGTSRLAIRPSCGSTGRSASTDGRLTRAATQRLMRRNTRDAGRRAEWRALIHYVLRGDRVLGRNVWAGGYEIDVIDDVAGGSCFAR